MLRILTVAVRQIIHACIHNLKQWNIDVQLDIDVQWNIDVQQDSLWKKEVQVVQYLSGISWYCQETRQVFICFWIKFCNFVYIQFLVKVWSENYIVMWRERHWMWIWSLFFEKKYSKYIESENIHLHMFMNL